MPSLFVGKKLSEKKRVSQSETPPRLKRFHHTTNDISSENTVHEHNDISRNSLASSLLAGDRPKILGVDLKVSRFSVRSRDNTAP